MSSQARNILAVIDPTQSEQWALQHAIQMAKRRGISEIYAFLCVHSELKASDESELEKVELRRQGLWLNELLDDVDSGGVKISPILQWASDWRSAIVDTANDIGAGIVIKRASDRPKSLTNSDRQLIRHLRCAMLLVKSGAKGRTATVLSALKLKADDKDHRLLDETVLQISNQIHGNGDAAEFHVVYAYAEPEDFLHPPDIAKRVRIDRSQVHSIEGKAATVIGDVATKISADLVVLGNVGRRGLKGISIGNTAEKVLSELQCDLLIISRETTAEQSAEAKKDVA